MTIELFMIAIALAAAGAAFSEILKLKLKVSELTYMVNDLMVRRNDN